MKIKFFLFLLFALPEVLLAQVSVSSLGLQTGDYQVGFQHYLAFDSTRTYKRLYDWSNNPLPRPIPVSIWYPSDPGHSGASQMNVLNYMEILKEEEEWEFLPNEQILNWFYYPDSPENQKHLGEKTNAYRNRRPAGKEYPVIVYAPSYQASSIENFALCEYLASHGFVIISSPSRGTENRFLDGGTAGDMETQAQDIEFLIKEVSGKKYADPAKIATMGFSFGGLSNVLAQMKNKNLKAIVSLDGSIKYQFPTLLKSPFADVNKVNVPFIHMAQKDIPRAVMLEDHIDTTLNNRFEFYDSLRFSNAYSLKFHHLTHPYFSTLGVLFQPRDQRQDKSDAEIMESYRWLSMYTLNFLKAHLNNEAEAFTFLAKAPAKNGVPEGLITTKSKAAKERAFTFEDFHELAKKRHYQNLEVLNDSITNVHKAFQLEEGKLNNLGLQLLFNPTTSSYGIEVLSFATIVYPESANLFDSLAEGYLFVGNERLAIRNFEKSLQLYPQNQNAINRLKELKR